MPTSFQNMATLTYTGGTVNSNIVTGELREVLTAAKTAVRENYEPGGTVTYVVSLTNSGVTPLTGLTFPTTWAATPLAERPCIRWPICRAAFGTM